MGKPKPPATAGSYSSSDRVSSGAVYSVDGYAQPLQGEPPVAKSKGWGDLRFLYQPRSGQ